jgi:hypothetical protein
MTDDDPETVRLPLIPLSTLVPEADLDLLPPTMGVLGTP